MTKFIFLIYTLLLLNYESKGQNINKQLKTPNLVKYKSDSTNELILNYQDFTYSYKEEYSLKAGEDLEYRYYSRGSFLIKNDTLIFQSYMPSEIKIKKDWLIYTGFFPLYKTDEQIEKNYVKIYFDNISELSYFSAFQYKNRKFEALKVIELKSGKYLGSIKTGKANNIRLSQYLLIEMPQNNKLLILDNRKRIKSYFFDLNKISSHSFHFYTRAYSCYYDFTGLKFIISNDNIKLIDDNRLNRFQNSIINIFFFKQ